MKSHAEKNTREVLLILCEDIKMLWLPNTFALLVQPKSRGVELWNFLTAEHFI